MDKQTKQNLEIIKAKVLEIMRQETEHHKAKLRQSGFFENFADYTEQMSGNIYEQLRQAGIFEQQQIIKQIISSQVAEAIRLKKTKRRGSTNKSIKLMDQLVDDEIVCPMGDGIRQRLEQIRNAHISDFFEEGPDSQLTLNWQKAKDKGSTGAVRELSMKHGKIHKITLRNGQYLLADKDGKVFKVKS